MFFAEREYLEPPDDSENAVLECSNCCNYIYDGDFYFVINGEAFCQECVEFQFGRYASFEDLE